ncbi:MAG: COX15/CtaA family protein, partial [Flavobacteriales bacterium]
MELVHPNGKRSVLNWLYTGMAMIFIMVAIGGITRLTESGLSITTWDPISGAIPPLKAEDWNQLFEKYKSSPEYIHKNIGMSLSEFKSIFWWEWIHRQWGRLIG